MKLSLLVLLFLGLYQSLSVHGADPLAASRSLYDPIQAQRSAAWRGRCLARTVEAYHKVGRKNAKWDAEVGRALQLYIDWRFPSAGTTNRFAKTKLLMALDRAVASGCDDPLVRYLRLSTAWNSRLSRFDDNLVEDYLRVAEDMEQSEYSSYWKSLAWAGASPLVVSLAGARKAPPELATAVQARRWLKELVGEPAAGIDEVQDCFLRLCTALPRRKELNDFWMEIKPTMFTRWPEEPGTYRMRGRVGLEQVRNGLYFLTRDPTNEIHRRNYRDFQKYSREAYAQAWNLAPMWPEVAVELIWLEVVVEEPHRERMELWFDRAMLLDVDNYAACQRKLYFLEPRWRGSAEEMLKFGRACLASTQWGGEVPLTIALAHHTLANARPDEDSKTDYWKQPEVWRDVRAAYEKCLAGGVPDPDLIRADYAIYALNCQQGAACLQQVSQLTYTNYIRFGGPLEFKELVQSAKDLTGAPGK